MTESAASNSPPPDSLVEELVVAGAVSVKIVTFPAGSPASGQMLAQVVAAAGGESPVVHIILNLEHVAAIQGPFLSELLKLMQRMRALGGSLKLCQLQKPIHDVLRVTRMEKLFECFPDRAAALASVAAANPAG
ncbi:MAG: STAS domain-containing protein [Pirellulales bacterium]